MYMKITYKQLSSEERDIIGILRIQGKSQGEIAFVLITSISIIIATHAT